MLQKSLAKFIVLLFTFMSCFFVYASEEDMVVDNANLFGSKITSVQSEAQKLENLGADVHIWTIDSIGDATNLDDYVRNLTKEHPSWMGNRPNDEYNFKSNFLMLIISKLEKKTGIYYGGEWLSALDPQKTRIQADHMNPKFKQGNFADGFVAGLHEINRVIDGFMHPSVSSQNTNPVVIVQPTMAPSQPTDFSGLWNILGWALGLFVLGFSIYMAISINNRMSKRKEEERQAQQSAKIVKQNAAKMRTEIFDKISMLKPIALSVGSKLNEIESAKIVSIINNIEDLIGTASQYYASAESTAGNPDVDGKTASEYLAMKQNFEDKVLSYLESSNSKFNDLDNMIKKFREVIKNADSKIVKASEVITHSQTEIDSIRDMGYKISEMDKDNSDAKVMIDEARKLKEAKEYFKMMDVCSKAEIKSMTACEKAKSIPKVEADLKKMILSFEARLESTQNLIERGRVVFNLIKSEYSEDLWRSVHGNGSEAEKRVQSAKKVIEEAKSAMETVNQEWDKGSQCVTRGNFLLDEAVSLTDSILLLKSNIEDAMEEVKKELDDAESDISKARDYIKRFGADIDRLLESDLKKSEQKISECKYELAKPMPNYIKALKLAREANNNADRVFDKSVSQHEVAERQRKQAESLFKEAERSIKIASNYIDSHRSDVDQLAKTKLSNAKSKLAQIKQSSDILVYIACATEVDKLADTAYEMAKKDVRDAEYKIRGDEREREDANSVMLATAALAFSSFNSDDYSISKRSSGGGGSSNYDSDNGGGGGSSNYDSDNGGGGGSTEW